MLHLHTGPLTDGDTLALVSASGFAALVLLWHALGLLCCAASRRRPQQPALVRLALRRAPAGPARGRRRDVRDRPHAGDRARRRADAHHRPGRRRTVRTRARRAGCAAKRPRQFPRLRPPPAPAPVSARTHVVVPGDNLWRIATEELVRVSGVARPSDAAIVPYWRAVVEQNRATLRSGDPSLIYPGEIVTLPAL